MILSKPFAAFAALGCIFGVTTIQAATFTFEDLPLGDPGVDGSTAYGSTGTYYWNGSNGAGGFASSAGGSTASFGNAFTDFGGGFTSWDGFAYSNTTDTTTAGFGNQYSAIAGSGAGGSSHYVITTAPFTSEWKVDFSSPLSLVGGGLQVTNATYAYLSMLNGDSFAKKFGGATGNDADWFKLTIEGWDGATSLGTVDFYLADYRFADNSQDYIVHDWAFIDLSALGGSVSKLTFSLSSSDSGSFGMNTPAYFALDNIVAFTAVPEPSAWAAIVGASLLGVAVSRRLKIRRAAS
jgi:hypothetical protein